MYNVDNSAKRKYSINVLLVNSTIPTSNIVYRNNIVAITIVPSQYANTRNRPGIGPFMYGHTYIKSMDKPGKVANPARGQLNREIEYFPVRVRA